MARSSTSNRGRQEKAAPEAISAEYATVSNRCYTTAGGAVTVAIERRGAFMEISVIDTGRTSLNVIGAPPMPTTARPASARAWA